MHSSFSNTISSSCTTGVGLGDDELYCVDEPLYVGHILTSDCPDDKHVNKIRAIWSWYYVGYDILIGTHYDKRPIIDVVFLSNVWVRAFL